MILEKIIAEKKKKLKAEKFCVSIEKLKKQTKYIETLDFKEAMAKEEGLNIIGEIKKMSPSKGIISKNFDFISIGKNYEENGIDAISVVTEEDFFLGKKEYLQEIRRKVNIPILRKDFIIDIYQIYESKFIGADAILLIAAILGKEELSEFQKVAKSIDLHTLVEVHNLEELKVVLDTGADIIGINNRNLKTFQVDIKTTEYLKKYIPENKLIISESGISTRKDIDYLKSIGVNGILVGEAFMKAPSIEDKLKEFRGD